MDLADLYLYLSLSPFPVLLMGVSLISAVWIIARREGPPRPVRCWLLLCLATWPTELLLGTLFGGAAPGYRQALQAVHLINWAALIVPLFLAVLLPRLRVTALIFGYLNAAICWLLIMILTMTLNDVWL